MFARVLLLAMAVIAAPVAAQTTASPRSATQPAAARALEGFWTLRIDGVVILAFRLAPSAGGWSGTWFRPSSFASDGAIFTRVEGPAVAIPASKVQIMGEWTELTFSDPRPGAVPDVFRMRAMPGNKAELIYVGTGFAPMALERGDEDTKIGPWPDGKSYRRPGVTPATGAEVVTFSSPPPSATVAEPVGPTSRRPAAIGR